MSKNNCLNSISKNTGKSPMSTIACLKCMSKNTLLLKENQRSLHVYAWR